MASFNIKDLMVSLEAQELKINQICYHFTCFGVTYFCNFCSIRPTLCIAGTCPDRSIICQLGTTPCFGGSCGFSDTTIYRESTSIVEIIPSLDINELEELKKGLQVLTQKIDSEYKPAKAKQLDQLESKLNETLKEVQDLRKKSK